MYYYMNNPCKIVREVTEQLVEIVVCVNFADGLEGSSWCESCNIDSMSSHTCDDYDAIIEQVMEETHEIPCIVERRLLSEEMVEYSHYCALAKEINKKKELLREWSDAVKEKKAKADELERITNGLMVTRDELTRQVKELTEKL